MLQLSPVAPVSILESSQSPVELNIISELDMNGSTSQTHIFN